METALSPLKQAFLALQNAQARIVALEAEKHEPIAVIGLGCRMPGGIDASPGTFWDLLSEGRDAVSDGLRERWRDLQVDTDEMPDRANYAALLSTPDEFDAAFFGISPIEAAGMDPQQRFLLEVSWEALENAGIAPTSVYGASVGVYFGICTSDYSMLRIATTELSELDAHFGSGNAHSIASGRVSYLLGLRGPSLSIDTACSSSLVAVHLASEALRRGECRAALAGGVNLIVSTEASRTFVRAGMLSPDGRCKSFAAAADGYVRGEGCGVVVLKRLRDAVSDGDRVLAVIRGSAVNHDGPSSGLTVPNGLAQQALIRQALKLAGIAPAEVGYVEAHGTGTTLGDPIEAEALGAVMAPGRSAEQPLLIGSVKTNIGHLEAAAGVAGLIKVVLALQHGMVPGQLHWDAPSPHIRWDALRLRVVDHLQPWLPINGRRIAGVSSFGFSGTNAHLVVEAAPATSIPPAEATGRQPPLAIVPSLRPLEILPLSAKTPGALRTLAARYIEWCDHLPPSDWPDLCHTAAVGRAPLAHRLSVRAADAPAGRAALQAFLAAPSHPAPAPSTPSPSTHVSGMAKYVSGAARPGEPPRVGFLFTGQGSQYPGMGRALYHGSPSVRRLFDQAEAALADQLEVPLGAVIRGEHANAAALLNQTLYTQPALYVLEYALAALWRGLGVEPVAVLGHSLGEYAGCAFAGVFGFEDGLRLVADRARLMQGLAADGAMLVVAASEAEVVPLLAGHEAAVSLAGVNAARQVTVSGARAAVDAIAGLCAARGWRTHALAVSQAFHSPLLDPIGAAFEARAGELSYAPPRLPVISNLTGAPLAAVSAGYWRRQMRQPVRFAAGLETLRALGCDTLIEIGPRPVLIQLARQAQAGTSAGPGAAVGAGQPPQRRYLTSLKGPEVDAWDAFCQAVQELHAAGAALDWAGWSRDYGRRKIDAPTYPFERRRHWITPSVAKPSVAKPLRTQALGTQASVTQPATPRHSHPATPHPLLGIRLRSALEGGQFEAEITASGATAWLADHRIQGQVILPATGLIEIMLAAGQAVDPRWRTLRDLSILAPLTLPPDGARTVQTVVDAAHDAVARVRVFAAETDAAGLQAGPAADGQMRFRLLAEASLAPQDAKDAGEALAALQARCPHEHSGAAHYQRLEARGATFGPAFQGVQRLWAGEHEALAEIIAPTPAAITPAAPTMTRPHPAVLDACLQSAIATVEGDETFMPVALRRLALFAATWSGSLIAHARLVRADAVAPELDFTVYDTKGTVVARLEGLRFQAVSRDNTTHNERTWLYTLAWTTDTTPAKAAAEEPIDWIVIGSGTLARAIAGSLRAALTVPTLAHVERCSPTNAQLIQALASQGQPRGIIYAPPDLDPAEIDPASARPGVEELLTISRLHAHHSLLADARLYVVTRKVHAVVAAEATLMTDAGISGLAATLFNEFPDLRCTRIDIDPADPVRAGIDIAREALAGTADDWIAYRNETRFAARLQWAQDLAPPAATEQGPVRLVSSQGLDGLGWRPAPPRALGPHEIEIDVRATPLNFRDVVSVVGLVSDQMDLGGECAGVVTSVGAAVDRFQVGEAVVALTPGSFASLAIAPDDLTIAKPATLPFETAAAQGIVYLTADHCLNDIAAMRQGERVLIHAAAGGVGLAAVRLCLRAGVEIFATAGSDAKRAYLLGLGVKHVLDSRSLTFASEIRRLTGTRGVDIILNSLTGAFVDAGLSLLAPGGRFVEIGKTDIRTPSAVAAAHPGVFYQTVDLTDRLRQEPRAAMARLAVLLNEMTSGDLVPVPHRTYAYADVKSAFRDLAQARQIGKLVLIPDTASRLVSPGSAYIVTGGLAGVGFRVAEWLAEQGAGRVLLMGRRPPAPEIADRIANWRQNGVDMDAVLGDVGNREFVQTTVATAGSELRGVIHCANVLDDAPVGELNWDRFADVMHPKAQGAWNLHCATAGVALDFFVMFSSWASLAGARGGANYAAANIALDSLAHLRRHQGLPALSIDWGLWATIGWAARLPGGPPARPGFKAMQPDQAIRALALAMRSTRATQLAIAPINWPVLLRTTRGTMASIWSEFMDNGGKRPSSGPVEALPSLAEVIAGSTDDTLRSTVVAQLQVMAAKALGIEEPGQIDPGHPLQEIGMDSILAVDLRNTLGRSLGVALPATLLFDHPTLNSLASYSIGLLAPPQPAISVDSQDDDRDLLELIEGLSDDEVDQHLFSKGVEIA